MDKSSLRERTWDALDDSGAARFPFPPHGRIPNFAGAGTAAERLAARPDFEDATAIKCNPDAPQRPVRRVALESGTTVYVAVPRLAEPECFLELDPDRIEDVDEATTISGASEYGVQTRPEDVAPIDLVVSGSVAVNPTGARVGKGEGYSDLEFAMLREFDRVDESTPVATTVHELQVLDESIETGAHDVPMDLIATPERVVEPEDRQKPTGIDWARLDEERVDEIPVLEELRGQ